jgi:hypothetical protein
MFQLMTTTECELTQFTGRTQKSGRDDVPAVSLRLKIKSAKNTLLDMLSPTIREVIYAPVEGQEQLPGVEIVTPVLRCPDMKTWKSEVVHEGWKLFISRGIEEDGGLQMGSCKVDEFTFDLYQGGHVDCEFRISTADLDEEGAGMLWGRQKRKVFVQLHAPEMPAAGATEATGAAIDGTVGHPGAAGQGSLLGDGDDDDGPGDDGLGGFDDDLERSDDGAAEQPTDPQRGENWPFPTGGAKTDEQLAAEREQAELEAGMQQAIDKAGVAPKGARRQRKVAAVGAVE